VSDTNFYALETSGQKAIFVRIFEKIKGKSYVEPSLLNEIPYLLKISYSYPFDIILSPEEKFWFEFIINKSMDEIEKSYNDFEIKKNNSGRLIKMQLEFVKNEFIGDITSRLYTKQAADYIRRKFIVSERIQNTPFEQKNWQFNK
jgi:hypothetical protein